MTLEEATKIAAERIPIYLKNNKEKGIKKDCTASILRKEYERCKLIKKLLNEYSNNTNSISSDHRNDNV